MNTHLVRTILPTLWVKRGCSLTHPKRSFRLKSTASTLLRDTLSYLRNDSNGAEIWLVGTAHISKQSAKEVEELIEVIKPTTIFVELCEQRAKRLKSSTKHSSTIEEITKIFSGSFGQKGFIGSVAEIFMKGFYKYLDLIGLEPGLEFKVAMEQADLKDIQLVLGDQPIDVTLRNLSRVLTLQELFKLMIGRVQVTKLFKQLSNISIYFQRPPVEILDLYENLSSLDELVEGMKRRVIVKKMQETLEKTNPDIVKILVHDRNRFMVDQLYKLKGRIVGVVGLGHLEGMEQLWQMIPNNTS